MKKQYLKIVGAGFLALFCWSASAQQTGMNHYQLIKTIEVGGDGFWDYLVADSAARRLYVTHSNLVSVIDMDSGKVVGEISGLARSHGVAVVGATSRGYITNGDSGKVTLFDLESLQIIGEVQAGKAPDAIIYDDYSQRVFVFNHAGGNVTVINAADSSVAGTVEVGGTLEYGVSDGRGSIFVNVEDRAEIVQIDSKKLSVVSRWKLGACEEPTGIAMDRETRRVFSACGGNAMLVVVNADNGAIVTTVAIGEGSDGARFDPVTKQIITANGEGSLSIIQEQSADKYSVVQEVTTRPGTRTLEVDLDTHKIYTATAELGPTPAAVEGQPRPRPSILPNTFVVMEYGR